MHQPHHSHLETASRSLIEARQLARLQLGLTRILPHNRFYEPKLLQGDRPLTVARLSDLQRLPFTSKAELIADQQAHPPYGRNLTYPRSEYIRFHQTSGTTGRPLKVLDTQESWDWWAECWRAVYRAAGVTRDDTVFLAFGFGPFIGFWSAYEGAKRLSGLGAAPATAAGCRGDGAGLHAKLRAAAGGGGGGTGDQIARLGGARHHSRG